MALCDNNDTELYSTAGLTMAVMQSLKESTIKEKNLNQYQIILCVISALDKMNVI